MFPLRSQSSGFAVIRAVSISATVIALIVFVQSAHAETAVRPNIIFIMADDLGYECLSCNGSTSYRTPRLDEMAAEGMRFTQAHSQPLCTPTRVKVMTGRYNFRNYKRFGWLDPNERTFGHILKSAGYKTCIAGKWQLGRDNSLPEHFGFDEHCLWQLSYHPRYGERYANPLIERNRQKLAGLEDCYGPDVFTNFVVDFIKRNHDGPFFAYYPMVLTHNPFVPTPDSTEWADSDRYTDDNEHFGEMVGYMDKLVGKIVDTVDELGIAEKTLIIFTGDNGTHVNIVSKMGDVEVRGGKGKPITTGTHVPFIARWKGTTPAGVVCDDFIDFSDILPTFAEASDAVIPDDREIDGHSFLPQLKGERGNPKEALVIHYDPVWGSRQHLKGRFVFNEQYKLYHDGRFYNTVADPLEEQPLELDALDAEANEARLAFQKIHDSLPSWKPLPMPDYSNYRN